MFVKPGPNRALPGTLLRVRIPHTLALLPDTGAEVPENGFWIQRLNQGDVVLADAPAAEAAAPAAEAAAPALATTAEGVVT
jgi:hypothetical protein